MALAPPLNHFSITSAFSFEKAEAILTLMEVLTMTKKDYIKIAQVLKDCNQTIPLDATATYTLDSIVGKIADMLQADTSRFDRNRFADYIYH